MRQILLATLAVAATLLAACSYSRTFGSETTTFEVLPDGTRILRIENETERIEFNVTGKSNRVIRKMVPFPLLEDVNESSSSPNPVPYEYRYEYRFDVYDINGDFADTITIETYDDFVAMMPVACVLAGYPVPSQDVLDAIAADMLPHWVDPETDWHLFN